VSDDRLATTASRILEWREVANQAVLPRGLADTAEFYVRHLDDAVDELVLGLRAHVLTEPGGDAVRDTRTVRWEEVQRPRWLPRRAWRRLRREPRSETVRLAVQPRWTYPHADLPRLGPAYRKAEVVYEMHDAFSG
jgi:hypothetical protein